MARPRVGIVIPALNESATITSIVEKVLQYGLPIVVDDGCTDNTAELASLAGATVVSHEINQGYDAALNSGFRKAAELKCEVIITLDADGQHDPTLIQRFLDEIELGADVVIGMRSRKQRLAEHIFAWYTSARYGIDDPLCGMKAYTIAVYQALGHFDSYRSIGTELAIYSAHRGLTIKQLSFVVRDRLDQPRFRGAIYGNCAIMRAAFLAVLRIK